MTEKPSDPTSPRYVTFTEWKAVFGRFITGVTRDNLTLMSAGVAFFAVLALIPGIGGLMSLAGLVFDRAEFEKGLRALWEIAPPEALGVFEDALLNLDQRPSSTLSIGSFIGLALGLYSANKATTALLRAVNAAYSETEQRPWWKLWGVSMIFTVVATAALILSIGLIILLPVAASAGAFGDSSLFYTLIRWPVLALFSTVGLAFVYRYAPYRLRPRWRWVSAGAIASTLAWLVASAGFSFYVTHFSDYGATFGSIGGVVVLLLWTFVSAYVVLVGAEANAAIEAGHADDANEVNQSAD